MMKSRSIIPLDGKIAVRQIVVQRPMCPHRITELGGAWERVYSSSRLVTLFGFTLGPPASDELLGSLVSERLVRADGVVDAFPAEQFLI